MASSLMLNVALLLERASLCELDIPEVCSTSAMKYFLIDMHLTRRVHGYIYTTMLWEIQAQLTTYSLV